MDWDTLIGDEIDEEHTLLLWLIKAYIFADRFLIPDFRHAINVAIVDEVPGAMGTVYEVVDSMKLAFDKIAADSPILQLLVNQCCLEWAFEDYDYYPTTLLSKLPAAFNSRVIIRMWELRRWASAASEHDKACYLERHVECLDEREACGKLHAEYWAEEEYARLC